MAPTLPQTYTGPALVDLQVNGYAGFDFNGDPDTWTPEAFDAVRDTMRKRGVFRALPTFITDDPDRMLRRARRYAEIVGEAEELAASFPLIHVEGPFVSSEEGPRGAHPKAHCAVPAEHPGFLDRVLEACGHRLGVLTLAPELPGALDLIAEAHGRGVLVAIGHTGAEPETIRAAVDRGARLSTHLGNGSHQRLPRLENYVQAQLAEDRLAASFIADGIHVPFYALKNFLRAKRPDRSILITDAVAPAEMPPGRYRLGEEEVILTEEGRVSKPGEWNLAGSALTLDRAVINVARHCEISFEAAWAMASRRPAELVGLEPGPEIRVELTRKGVERVTVE